MKFRSFALSALLVAFASPVAHAGDAPTAEQKVWEDKLRRMAPPAPAAAPMGGGALASQSPKASSASFEFSDATVEGSLGTTEMRKANRVAAEILQRRMEETRPNDFKLIREAAGADVVVLSGVYDRVQDVLRAVQIKHVVVPPHLLDQMELLSTQTVMLNCPGNVTDVGVKKLRDFVARGGYLVSTDWALRTVEKAFPGTISHNGKTTPNDVVSVQVHDDKEPLLRHVKVMREHPRWWLEGSSYPIHIKDPKQVRVLMSSQEMQAKYGDGAVVVSFHHQQGKVLHMTSHFFLQQSKLVEGSEKQKGSSFAKGAGLSDAQIGDLAKKGIAVDEVKAGELNAAYSMQQVSTNLIAEKQAQNQEMLRKRYSLRVRPDDLALSSDGTAAPTAQSPRLKKDFRVEVLERKGKQAKVRDLFGHEGWVQSDALY
ncbi:MAG TPA: SH3 domain-containing protein [Pseudomonadota bacterium]|nr:SH3 domain-containing protein [Pseudomonadota bacterium]